MLEELLRQLITSVGEDASRPGLIDTPQRAAKAWQYLTHGYQLDQHEIVNGALFPTNNPEMVLVKNIELYSLCEHHLLPFIGKCHVAYLPNQHIIGLSKIARIVDMYARRLQVQEHLTQQIAHNLAALVNARGVGVIITAQHLCMTMRGVAKQQASMTTTATIGAFNSHKIKAEFLQLVALL